MSTTSQCMKTSADSSWGLSQIKKEVYVNLHTVEQYQYDSVQTSHNSCNARLESTSGHQSSDDFI